MHTCPPCTGGKQDNRRGRATIIVHEVSPTPGPLPSDQPQGPPLHEKEP